MGCIESKELQEVMTSKSSSLVAELAAKLEKHEAMFKQLLDARTEVAKQLESHGESVKQALDTLNERISRVESAQEKGAEEVLSIAMAAGSEFRNEIETRHAALIRLIQALRNEQDSNVPRASLFEPIPVPLYCNTTSTNSCFGGGCTATSTTAFPTTSAFASMLAPSASATVPPTATATPTASSGADVINPMEMVD